MRRWATTLNLSSLHIGSRLFFTQWRKAVPKKYYLMLISASASLIAVNNIQAKERLNMRPDFFKLDELEPLRKNNKEYIEKYYFFAHRISEQFNELNDNFPEVSRIEARYRSEFLEMKLEDIAVELTGSKPVDYASLYEECMSHLSLDILAKNFFPSESEIRTNTARYIFSKKYEFKDQANNMPRITSLYFEVRSKRIEILKNVETAIRHEQLTRTPQAYEQLEADLIEHHRTYGIQCLIGIVGLRYERDSTKQLTLDEFYHLEFDPYSGANDVYDMIDNKATYAVYREKYEALVAQNKIDPNMTCYDFALLDTIDETYSLARK